MARINVPEVLADLQAVVAEKGDGYIYEDPDGDSDAPCVYVYDGQPRCIVGHVLARRGLLDAEFVHGNNAIFNPYAKEYFTEDALRVLEAAQECQDSRRTWGDALIEAKDRAEHLR